MTAFQQVRPPIETPVAPDLGDGDDVVRILCIMRITEWQQEALIPAYNGHYLRSLNMTVDTVNSFLGLSINLPDTVGRDIVQRGGIRLGLVDFDKQTRDALFNTLAEGRSLGEGPVSLARRIRSQIPKGPWSDVNIRARVIARTETKFAQNISSIQAYRHSGVVEGVLAEAGSLMASAS